MNQGKTVVDAEGRDSLTVTVSVSEAIVLSDWLNRTSNAGSPAEFADRSEQIALWDLAASLESALIAPLRDDYIELLHMARADVRGRDS